MSRVRGIYSALDGGLISAEAEELSLFGPVGRQPRCQAHQCLGGELRGLSAIDGGRKNTSISGVTLSDVCCIHSNSLRPSGSISGRHWRWLLCWL
jgi:hypothetical protein